MRCFISAPANADVSVIRSILKENEVQVYDPYDFSIGDSINDLITSKIKKSDFAIVVLTSQSINVFYEMGICEGMGKPILAILSPEVETPYFVQTRIHLRSDLKDTSLLRITIEQFISQLRSDQSKLRRRPSRGKTEYGRPDLKDYISKVQRLRKHGSGLDIEKAAFELFKGLGLDAAFNDESQRDTGVDFAIWSDALTSAIGNPLLIEVKGGDLSKQRIREAELQLTNHIARTDAKAAILLYLDKRGKRFHDRIYSNPLVIRFDLEDFARELEVHSFEDIVLSARNKLVHGVSD